LENWNLFGIWYLEIGARHNLFQAKGINRL
jgi:hypothetical protein